MADPVQGTLLPVTSEDFQPVCTQDVNGVVIDLTQTVGERNGKFFPGCGHSINSWEIRFAAVAGVKKALIVCPLCRYIQSIRDPADVENEAHVVG